LCISFCFFVNFGSPNPSSNCSAPSYPRSYICYKTNEPITIDGVLNDTAWDEVEWTEYFMDIRGPNFTTPRFYTHIKMRYDDNFLYIGAYLQEPQIWANVTQKKAAIYYDNDFEVFVDVDGSNHNYKEFEVNAINNTWTLFLNKPYDDGGSANDSWVMPSMVTAIYVEGQVNNASVICKYWTVEIAFPLKDLMYLTSRNNVSSGDLWRINFSRVEWQVVVVNGSYQKIPNWCVSFLCPPGGIPEDNWVWSPQYVVAMHRPEKWGYLQFSDGIVNSTNQIYDNTWTLRYILMEIYYSEKDFFNIFKNYTQEIEKLDFDKSFLDSCTSNNFVSIPIITLGINQTSYQVDIKQGNLEGHLSDDRKLWFNS